MFFRGQTIGKYRIVSSLGSGGFGAVYLAEDTWIDKKVAIKVPHRQNIDFGELLREPRLLASLSHPNIVTILTAEKQENVFFIVMEYVQGETLEAVIEREGSLDLVHMMDLTCQICNAVDHAHSQGVLHRDVGAVRSFWQRQIFSGNAVPPAEKPSEDEVLAFVRANPGGVGYVAESTPLPAGVKTITLTD